MPISGGLRKRVALALIFLLLFSTFSGLKSEVVQAQDTVELQILHTNDFHSHIDDFGKIAAYVDEQRAEADHSLYLDAGDIFSGNPVVDIQDGQPIIDLLNDLQLDAMAIGNHEFDYGPEVFMQRQEESAFPWLSANFEVTQPEETVIEDPQDYEIFEFGTEDEGFSVGVVGLTQTPPSTAPSGIVGLDFFDPVEQAEEYVYLQDEVAVLIALTHIGHEEDERLAENVEFFDLIVGGHSHRTITATEVNGTPIVQAGANGSHVGNLTLQLDPATEEVSVSHSELQSVAQLTEIDEEIEAKVEGYKEEVREKLEEVVGHTNTGLTRNGRYDGDAPLGNFYTDAMRHATEADMAFANNGGIRTSIDSGDMTVFDLHMLEPFRNQVMTIEMTGEAIAEVIEYSYSRRNQIDLQTSGLAYTIISNPTGGYHDVQLELDGEDLDPDQSYVVAVGDYIGTGGSGYNFEGEVLDETAGVLTEVMADYARYLSDQGKDIDYEVEGRIQVEVDENAPPSGEPIGETENGLYSANKSQSDVGLGNLYTDAIRDLTESEIGLLNSSSVTGEIPPGIITDEQIEHLDPFGNEIEVVLAEGEQIVETILSQANYHNGVDLQASGIEYTLIEGEGAERFTDVDIQLADGSAFDPDQTYQVAYNDYMHSQPFYHLGEAIEGDYGLVWEATVDYVENHEGPIDYEEGERIQIEYVEGEPPEGPRDPEDVIHVKEAIANNEGEAIVEGYIVGHIISASNVHFEPPFTNDFNFALADDPRETDLDQMLFVQVTADFREEFGLETNPDIVGEKVRVGGYLEAYHTRPGLRNPQHIGFVDDGQEPQQLPIEEVRGLEEGVLVTTEGVVTSTPGAWGSKGFYVQNEEAGLYVYQHDFDVEVGDHIQVTGQTDSFNEEFQLTDVTELEILGTTEVPDPITLTPGEVGEENQGQLILLEEVTIAELEQVNDFGTFEFQAQADEESVLIRVDNRTGLAYEDFAFEDGDVVDIIGASSQFWDTYQVKPRMSEDITESESHTPTLDELKQFLEEMDVHKGFKQSTLARLQSVEKHVDQALQFGEQGKVNQASQQMKLAYEKLSRLMEQTEQRPDSQVDPQIKETFIEKIQRILEQENLL